MVLDWDGARPLQFKYRKSTALLGYLIGQARREVRRELLAQWLWPDLDTQAGRANLRVVLADLQAQWRQLALPGTIRVERDWIMYKPAAGLCADLEIRTSPHLLDAIEGELPADWIFALQSEPADWLAGADEGASEEFREWLGVQRQRMEAVRSDREVPAPAAAASAP